jgi:hypothetical protein
MNHKMGSLVFGAVVGVLVAIWAYQWVSDPVKRERRTEQETVVEISRTMLRDKLAIGDIELVDPLAPQRKVGKVYVYPLANGWEISGYYRRSDQDLWHPYLMALSQELSLESLKISDSDAGLAQLAAMDPNFEVLP